MLLPQFIGKPERIEALMKNVTGSVDWRQRLITL